MEKLLSNLRSKFHGKEWYFSKHNKIIDSNYLFIKYPAIKQIPSTQKEKIELLSGIDPRIIDSLLLKMEMLSSQKKENHSTDSVIKKTLDILSRYQWKCGGYHIDSLKWELVTKKNAKDLDYTIDDKSIVLINTINSDLENDKDTKDFFDMLDKKLNKISKNHVFEIKSYEKDTDSKYRTEIAIWISDVN